MDRLTTLRRTIARDDRGMSTAEYAVGTVGACTIGGVLVKIGQSDWFGSFVKGIIDHALDFLPF
ncbi:MAG: DUF4244 domain-containing protein [Nocardioidaceae bacterium]